MVGVFVYTMAIAKDTNEVFFLEDLVKHLPTLPIVLYYFGVTDTTVHIILSCELLK